MMRKEKLLGLLLAVIMFAGVLGSCGSPSETSLAPALPSAPADKVQLVLFHFTQR